jgi:hypothetical protein
MLNREKDGKLKFKTLDFEIFISDLFAECKTLREVSWLQEEMLSRVNGLADERADELD